MKPKFSLTAYIEQMAKTLRQAAKTAQEKTRSYSKKKINPSNKIEQIARMLREEVKKPKTKKKR